jgi:hypothetical protein
MSNFPKRLTVKINVDKIKKEHLYKGKKGTYLKLVAFNTPDNPYGQDFGVKQDLGKDNNGDYLPSEFIGEVKAWAVGEGTPTPKEDQTIKIEAPLSDALRAVIPPAATTDDLPF